MKRYALCDAKTLQAHHTSLEEFIQKCQKHNIEVIQYRNKEESLDRVKKALLELRKLWDGYLIINDYVELVSFCDGVHLGQEDLLRYGQTPQEAVQSIRKVIKKDKILGLSTHNEAEILEANRLDLNYIGLGAYRATQTKEVTTVLGEELDKLAARSTHPVAAIGGVTFDDDFEHVAYLVVGRALYEA